MILVRPVAEAGDLAAVTSPRLSRLIPGSSLKVWMVRARLSMRVVVVVDTREEVMEEVMEEAEVEAGGGREERGRLMSRMWTTSGSHDTWDTWDTPATPAQTELLLILIFQFNDGEK